MQEENRPICRPIGRAETCNIPEGEKEISLPAPRAVCFRISARAVFCVRDIGESAGAHGGGGYLFHRSAR
jgi:hypothetical protein